MATRRRGLGRGLDALLQAMRGTSDPNDPDWEQTGQSITSTLPPAAVVLPINSIAPNKSQPRRNFHPERLQELADSIASQGVLQPILVRPLKPGCYEIIAGERRWRASQLAELTVIPAVVKAVDGSVALAISLIENIQRDSLSPLEEATALRRLMDEFDLTQQAIAEAVGKSRSTVNSLLRLLDLMPQVKQYLEANQINLGHAKILLGLEAAKQDQMAAKVVSKKLSVRETELLVQRETLKIQTAELALPYASEQAEVLDLHKLQAQLAKRLGVEVQIRHKSRGNGKLLITYNSPEELTAILGRIS